MIKLPMRAWLVFCLFLLSAIAFLDRTNISIAGPQISREFSLDNVQLGWVLSAFLVWICNIPGICGMDCGPAWAAARTYTGGGVVGGIHARYCAGFSSNARRPVDADRGAFHAGSWRGDHVSGFKSICGSVDSCARARPRQRRHLCRGRRRSRIDSAVAGRNYRRAWMARRFLVQRCCWCRCRCRLVSHCARHSRRASTGLAR